jgi:hypothetical protein
MLPLAALLHARQGGSNVKSRSAVSWIMAGALLLGMPLLAAAQGMHQGTAGLEQVLAASADTPAEHQALHDHYKARAEEARNAAEAHRSMSTHYSGSLKPAVADRQKAHCKTLATSFDEQAKAYDELAKGHAEAAAAQ